MINRLSLEEKAGLMSNNSPAIERLGIPEYNWWNEALHGLGRSAVATVFPQAIGMGATFDPELIKKVASTISDEARANYNDAIKKGYRRQYSGLTFWTPNINIFRDPRWGRGQETYGEDPFLT
ncbi:MAG: glycoside hydrolase family 3 N-terminal domain-containing protein, partial [Salegentibacter sp.]